jgi:endonuclease/exonuclease/phosphatase family metal-dependent hydrolase
MSMRFHRAVAGLGAGAAIVAGAVTVMGVGSSAHAASSAHDLQVGSFNLSGVNGDNRTTKSHRPWYQRRPVVVGQILARKLDVVGVQEANQSTIYKKRLRYGSTQYLDLRGALNHRGGHYALTNTASYNCAHPMSTYHCRKVNRNASGDNRILYNTRRIALVKQGAMTYSRHARGRNARFLAWAVLRVRSTGRQFLFTNTHLDPYGVSARKAEWTQMIKKIDQLKAGRPVIAVGDFNTSKFSSYAGHYLAAMKSHGYGDVLNQSFKRNTLVHRRAEHTYRAWVSSFNGYRRNVASYSYSHDRAHKIGNGIDWIFASNGLRVKGWEVVAHMNRHLRTIGVIPSDHHMVRSTLVL